MRFRSLLIVAMLATAVLLSGCASTAPQRPTVWAGILGTGMRPPAGTEASSTELIQKLANEVPKKLATVEHYPYPQCRISVFGRIEPGSKDFKRTRVTNSPSADVSERLEEVINEALDEIEFPAEYRPYLDQIQGFTFIF